MSTVDLILWVVAMICFGLAAFKVTAPVHLGWLGAAFVALAMILG